MKTKNVLVKEMITKKKTGVTLKNEIAPTTSGLSTIPLAAISA
jgi:hypothetical protein